MAHKTLRHSDGSSETWDDATGLYVHTGADGAEIESRPLSQLERNQLDPNVAQIQQLMEQLAEQREVMDQLLLDQLMNSLAAGGDLGDLGLL